MSHFKASAYMSYPIAQLITLIKALLTEKQGISKISVFFGIILTVFRIMHNFQSCLK